jgi:hypothetical protein
VFLAFLHFSPFGTNVEIFSIAHLSIDGREDTRIVRAHSPLHFHPSDWASRSFPLRASNEGLFPFSPTHPCGAETPHIPPGHASAGRYCSFRSPSFFRIDRTGGHSPARIVRAHTDRARTASTSVHPSGLCFLPSLPPRHFISLLLQTPVHEIRVSLVGPRRHEGGE